MFKNDVTQQYYLLWTGHMGVKMSQFKIHNNTQNTTKLELNQTLLKKSDVKKHLFLKNAHKKKMG